MLSRAQAVAGLGLALLIGTAPARTGAEELRLGFARRVITPQTGARPAYLAGFAQNRRATGVHDDLYARACAMSDGARTQVIVAVDLIGLSLEEVEEMRTLLAARLSRPVPLVVASTHNHQGPDTIGLWGPSPLESGVDPAYLAFVRERVVEAGREALGRLRPARLTFAAAHTPELIEDRRLPRVIDDEIRVALAQDDQGRTLGTLVNWGSHAEALGARNTEITADFPGALVETIEAELGGTCVFLAGALGGLATPLGVQLSDSSGRPIPEATFEHAQAIGKRAGQAALAALAREPRPATRALVELRTRRVRLPLQNPLYRGAKALGLIDRTFFTHGRPDRRVAPGLSGASALLLPMAEDLETEIGWLRVGELELLLVPGEIYPELVLGGVPQPAEPNVDFPSAPAEGPLAALLRSPARMFVGLADDEIGYVIPRSEWDAQPPFAYGLRSAPYGEVNSVGDRAAPILAAAFQDLLR